ncbi:hypothetical protein [uncultured Marixanthomonas sp.]|uniref:hypothetical protein n=1 Tax=uncultured Marixanthomonas sp. TaxID=757245 RepID=UPI0030D7F89B|tara:strand:+ start:55872 stop:56246 length:375 start_codon:yes stop_codon:yes gene_type:complete
MKKVYIFILFLILLSAVLLIIFLFYNKVLEMTDKKASDFYKEDDYKGIVVNKFIDTEQHNYHKVVVKKEENQQTILFDHENGGLFEFIKIGDSLTKTRGNLKIRLQRENLDTIIKMEIYDWKFN